MGITIAVLNRCSKLANILYAGFQNNMILNIVLIGFVRGLYICNEDIQCDLSDPKLLTACVQEIIDACIGLNN